MIMGKRLKEGKVRAQERKKAPGRARAEAEAGGLGAGTLVELGGQLTTQEVNNSRTFVS